MKKHTPGPWQVQRVAIHSRGGSNTCFKIGPFGACIYDDYRQRENGISEEENQANAALISAAPEMLAILKAYQVVDKHSKDCHCALCVIVSNAEGESKDK